MYPFMATYVSAGIVTANKAAGAAQKADSGNVREQIARYLREGKPLPKNLDEKFVAALGPLHEEVRLHTYTPRIFKFSLKLREQEAAARARFDGMNAMTSVEEVRAAFEAAISDITHVFLETINEGKRLDSDGADDMTDEERTTVYLAAAILHSLLIVWEDAAKAMLLADVGDERSEDKVLDFADLDSSVIDVAEQAFGLYGLVEQELHSIRRGSKSFGTLQAEGEPRPDAKSEREKRARHNLAMHDLGIVHLNMASISSHALDWSKPESGYIGISGAAADDAARRLSVLTGGSHKMLEKTVHLMKRHNRHVLIARNVAYMALQHGAPAVLREAATQLATQLDVDPTEVWSVRIAGREPLVTERDISTKFEAGQPIILNTQEA